ncbi:adp-ribosylation factor-like protein 2-binding protein [Holotrichia oblita]|uniref:Adp-ribosylation factor-like protein 2-binding protein n=1 Tax=Holotrichia oblita TaxID=644536 RepID=A0ACB9TCV4_HOLOL|nr:adp-ribosylation factor-like protein 2-binding protein [Holotrichia oblita]
MNEFSDDINFTHRSSDDTDQEFHSTVGHIEDILMEDKFLELHNDFMEKHWQEFEESEENKFIYTDIFKEYQATIEKYIEEELVKKVKNFNMLAFEEELKKRPNELDSGIFDLLSTFTDFIQFKTKFLDYKAVHERRKYD